MEPTGNNQATDGVRTTLVFDKAINYAFQQNAIPVIQELHFHNDLTTRKNPGLNELVTGWLKLSTIKVSLITIWLLAMAGLTGQAQLGFTVSGGVATITGYNTNAGSNVVIPASTNGYTVTAIGVNAFYTLATITNVIIPSSVTSIDDDAFQFCQGLENLVIGSGVASIGVHSFAYCGGLTNVTIPNSVTTIGAGAFSYCSGLKGVTIPNSVTNIGVYAFYFCPGLTSVTIPKSVTSMDGLTFDSCLHLTNIMVDAANPNYASSGGVLFDKTISTLIEYPNGLIGNYTIPNSVTQIGDNAFDYCSGLTSVLMLTNVTAIGSGAFFSCSGLTSVTIPNSVASLGNYTFESCSGLTSVVIPNSVTNIGIYAFYDCSALTNLLCMGNAPGLGVGVFGGVNTASAIVYYVSGAAGWGPTYGGLTTVAVFLPSISTQPNDQSVNAGGNATFNVTAGGTAPLGYQWYFNNVAISGANDASYSINHATLANSGPYYVVVTNNYGSVTSSPAQLLVQQSGFTFITNAGVSTITGYDPTVGGLNVVIPVSIYGDPVTAIGASAFSGLTNLASVTIPNTVTNVGSYALSGCWGLSNVIIGTNVFNISDYAFYGCSGLNSLTIPDSVTNIGAGVFYGCSGLTNVMIGSGLTSIGSQAFFNCSGLSKVTFPNSLTSISTQAFFNCSALTSVTIPNNLTSIGSRAFQDCSNLLSISVNAANPNYGSVGGVLYDKTLATLIQCPGGITGNLIILGGVTSIGDSAFYGCSGLASVTIPNSLTNIGSGAFYICLGLTNVVFGNGVISIGGSAFQYCSALKSVTIPNSVNSIGAYAFDSCSGLASVVIGTGINSMGSQAFYNCSGLTNLLIDNGVTTIGYAAFVDCSNLTSVTIPNSITNLSGYAFEYCPALHQAYFQGNAPTVNGIGGIADNTLFKGDSGTVFYPPGATGWRSTFGGWPTATGIYQQQPAIGGSGTSFGVRNNQFHFTILWATNTSVVIQESTNLLNWTSIATNVLSNGTNSVSVPAPAGKLFFRLKQ